MNMIISLLPWSRKMIKTIGILGLFTALTLTFSSCNKETTDPDTPDVIGTWTFQLPSLIADSMNLNLKFIDDKNYEIELVEKEDKQLFSSEGTWSFESDSIKLVGAECAVIDTVANPDTLMPLSEATCSTPIVIAPPDSPESWEITTSTMRAPLAALIAEPMLTTVIQAFQIIPLSRVK